MGIFVPLFFLFFSFFVFLISARTVEAPGQSSPVTGRFLLGAEGYHGFLRTPFLVPVAIEIQV